MATTDLLEAVLSADGWYCVLGLALKPDSNASPSVHFVKTLNEVHNVATSLHNQEYDVFFGCAKYENDTDGRTQKNSKYFKSFWLDIDCGFGKPYDTQEDGLNALRTFCNTLGLPFPTVVNSGRGLHVYWRLEETISKQEWKPVAERLKALSVEHEFYTDPTRTAESASVLRIPETSNFKQGNPLPVEIIHVSEEISYEAFKNIIGVLIAPDYIPRQINEMTKALMGNRQSRFETIMLKTANGGGCAQLEHIMLNQEAIEEPLWRAGLSIAAHCIDGDVAIHKLSSAHPEYSPEATEKKAKSTKGPYTCDTFEKINPNSCKECPNRGKINSPITLGNEIIESEPNVVIEEEKDNGAKEQYVIPQYPYPYFRGKNGGVYAKIEDKDGNTDALTVYEHDLYVVKRIKDPNKGDSVWIRLHLPKDGVREFAMPQTEALSYEKLSQKLAWHGVAGNEKQMKAIMQYIIIYIKELQHKEEIEIMRTQFGWTEDNDKFIVGDKEISAIKVSYSPPSSLTGALADSMQETGSYAVWKEVAKTYDSPGFEPHAFGFFTAFGAPLLKHLNLRGAIINLINNTSGTGKSTILKMCNSVWGHPEDLMLQWKDTQNVMMHRLGIMNNLPLTIDEITKLSADNFSDLVYSISQGRGKNRMKQHENEERRNFAQWATIALCSSNASFQDKLNASKATPDGELMRLIEYRIEMTDILTKEEADVVFNKLYTNYGHAGIEYAKYLVGNLESTIDLVREVQKKVDKAVGFTNRERFWSGVVACNIAGALLAKDLGIIDFDVKRVYDWIVEELKVMRLEVKPPSTSQSSVIGEFMNEHRASTLAINGQLDGRSGMEQLPIVEPKFNDLFIRIEPDMKRLYINAKQLKAYCAKQQITLKDVLLALQADGAYLGTVKKRLSKGTKLQSPPVDTYIFNLDSKHFSDPEHYIEAAKASEEIENADSRS